MRHRHIRISLVLGILITATVTVAAFMQESRERACVLLWQWCGLQELYHPHTGGFYEGTPADPIILDFGVLLGIPIYAALAYAFLSLLARFKR